MGIVVPIADVRAAALPLVEPDEVPNFERLYEQYVDFVWRSARRLGVSDDALDDVVQKVFLVVHRQLGGFQGRASYKTWIFSILLRVVQDHRRYLRRRVPSWLVSADDAGLDHVVDTERPSPFDAVVQADAARLVEELLGALDDDKRAVFVLAELEQMTLPEIAQATGVNVKTIHSRLRAARAEFERAADRWRAREARRAR
ncbi:RNA polymerase sigma factor RpoE [Labilithrix luteola]|uniref:RNA polymerase sigma factor RpoE n=1 Tax=Labilithrix luteola TaxID=1391654 RepID=A0A0K1PKQ1_9BACT|nr:RNA polymerase sigma factor [Labilithrix luteola]AKU94097.1 RNA polymerase sigma factor RpoE [Labilithrix luteola]